MSQNFDTTIALSAGFDSPGQPVNFDGAFVTGLTITNNSGVSIQYSADGGLTWVGMSNGATASPAVPDANAFLMRKMAGSGSPVPVHLTWSERNSEPSYTTNPSGTRYVGRVEPDGSVTSIGQDQQLAAWGMVQAFQVIDCQRNADGAITTASIAWPDGVSGTYTADTLSAEFPGATDAWHATYVGATTNTITQPAVTRDENGAVIAQPAITVI